LAAGVSASAEIAAGLGVQGDADLNDPLPF
jgi:hypothetical protein